MNVRAQLDVSKSNISPILVYGCQRNSPSKIDLTAFQIFNNRMKKGSYLTMPTEVFAFISYRLIFGPAGAVDFLKKLSGSVFICHK